jgi:hypothetical protein
MHPSGTRVPRDHDRVRPELRLATDQFTAGLNWLKTREMIAAGRINLSQHRRRWPLNRIERTARSRIIGEDRMSLQRLTATIVPALDRRQSETALAVARGTARLLRTLGFACVSEVPLPSGRRADLVALNERGDFWIVEIKSSLDDLRADHKWQDYRMHCDRLFFAFPQDLPCDMFPDETGLIVADAYGAHLHCEAPEHRLNAATRKVMLLRFAQVAAQRLNRLHDPQGHGDAVDPGV